MTVKVGTLQLVDEAGFLDALGQGYFRQEGIEVQLEQFGNTSDQITALATGDLQFGQGSPDASVFNAITRGIDVKIVGENAVTSQNDPSAGFVVRKDLIDSGQFKGPADLKGLKIALPEASGLALMNTQRLMAQGGLTLNDAQITALAFPDMMPAMANKAIDVGFSVQPFIGIMAAQGSVVFQFPIGSVYPGEVGMVMMVSPKLAAQNPEVVRRFVTAYLRGNRDYYRAFVQKSDPALSDTITNILIQYTLFKDPQLIPQLASSVVHPDNEMDIPFFQDYQNFLVQTGEINQPIDLAKLFEPSYTDYALARLGRFP